MVENKSLARSTKPHSHDYNEIVGISGTNFDDPWDLCGEAEITLNGEKIPEFLTPYWLLFAGRMSLNNEGWMCDTW
jgi:hypothetical protein